MKYSTDTLGVMIDVSRDAVMSLPALKRFLKIIKKMGYNMAMLYTEDIYEIEGEPYFGYMRGRYSKAELKEIDDYAYSIGIEMIPCIQTLAHLATISKWKVYPMEGEGCMLTDDERIYKLIDGMFATVSECFRSRRIHIGMDEAGFLGRGAHLNRFGYEEPREIMKRHLARVNEIAKKYGYERPMIWSDMIFNACGSQGNRSPKMEIPEEAKAIVPKNVLPVYWEYDIPDESLYDGMLYNHTQITDELWFAGSVIKCRGYVPQNKTSLRMMLPAFNMCKKYNCRNIIITLWGDDGACTSNFAALPALCYYTEYLKGNTDEEKIKAKFKRIVGVDYDDFISLDCLDYIDFKDGHENPSKYMLFSDIFCGFLDYTVTPECGERYKEYTAALNAAAKKTRTFGYLFSSEAKLSSVLEIKYALGYRLREAYKSNNRAELEAIVNNDLPTLKKRVNDFYKAYRVQWNTENKFYGFETEDIRLGGLLQRLESCRLTLKDYLDGKINKIDALEEEILPLKGVVGIGKKEMKKGISIFYSSHHGASTPSPIL